jgi:hypothetical protein
MADNNEPRRQHLAELDRQAADADAGYYFTHEQMQLLLDDDDQSFAALWLRKIVDSNAWLLQSQIVAVMDESDQSEETKEIRQRIEEALGWV